MLKLTHSLYFDALKEDRLIGLQCPSCNAYTVPPRAACQGCGSFDLDPVQLKGSGSIVTFTVVRVSPEGLKAPYIVVMVELDEGPWLMGKLQNADVDKASMNLIGKRVRVTHEVVAGMNYTACEGVIPLFSLVVED
jgi:uncharacterized OB-fold protein